MNWFSGCDTKQAKKARLSELAKRYHPDLHPEDFERYNGIMQEILEEYRNGTTAAKTEPQPEPRPDPEPVANRPSDEEIRNARRLYTTETAALIRQFLKRRFPGMRFYVTSDRGGGAVNIRWIDGPDKKTVETAVAGFQGRGFDGMTDSNYYLYSWFLPDGSATIAGADWIPSGSGFWNPRPHPKAVLVSFSPFVFCERCYSAEFLRRIAQEAGVDIPITAGIRLGRNTTAYHYGVTYDNSEEARRLYKIAEATNAYTPPQPRRTTKTKATTSTKAVGDVTVTHDRDWTWVTFPGKAAWDALGEKKQAAFKALGFRWSRRRRAWYATRHIEADEIGAAIS